MAFAIGGYARASPIATAYVVGAERYRYPGATTTNSVSNYRYPGAPTTTHPTTTIAIAIANCTI